MWQPAVVHGFLTFDVAMLRNAVIDFGRYLIMLGRMFQGMEKIRVYWDGLMREMVGIGIGSLAIVVIISLFVGAVMTILTSYQLISEFIPPETIGQVVSKTVVLEMAPTVTSLVLAGKVGSGMASELGNMRVSEQIDALEVMGINSSSYLVFPKLLASMLVFPMLIVVAAFLMHLGGVVAGDLTGTVSAEKFHLGAMLDYRAFDPFFMLLKAIVFGGLIASISSFHGYYVKGGSREVGEASTRAVVYSCIAILGADYLLAQYLL